MAITNKDVDKLKEVFATKEDLNRFATKDDLEKLKEVFATKEDFKQYKTEVMNGLDKVMDELVKAREDRTFAVGKDREQDRRIDSLESRMEKVEAKVG